MIDWIWRDYQESVIQEALAGDKKALIAVCRGGGKTAMAVEIVRRGTEDNGVGSPCVVIVAPLATHGGWKRHVELFMPGTFVGVIDGTKKGKENGERALAGEAGVWLIGWERNRAFNWSKTNVSAVILDETGTRIANRKTKQTKAAFTLRHAPIKLALSATPAGNKIEGIWPTLHFLWPDRYKHFWPWVKAFLNQRPDPFAGWVIAGEKRAGIVAKNIPNYIKRTEEEVHGELPGVVVHDIEVKLTPGQYKVYKQFEQDGLAWLDANPVAAGLPITKRARMLQTCLAVPSLVEAADGTEEVTFADDAKSSKLDALVDILRDMGQDEKVLVWTHSKKIVPVVAQRLEKAGHKVATRIGGQTTKERERNDSAFLEGDAQVLVATIPALSEGWDGAQHVCSTEVWLSVDESVTLNYQAEGRLNRPGQKHVINRYFINARDTIETRKIGRIESNKDLLRKAGVL